VIGWVSQLDLLAPVCLASPQSVVEETDVGDGIAVAGEHHAISGQTSEERDKLS
jgi:hypothetical protein